MHLKTMVFALIAYQFRWIMKLFVIFPPCDFSRRRRSHRLASKNNWPISWERIVRRQNFHTERFHWKKKKKKSLKSWKVVCYSNSNNKKGELGNAHKHSNKPERFTESQQIRVERLELKVRNGRKQCKSRKRSFQVPGPYCFETLLSVPCVLLIPLPSTAVAFLCRPLN